MVIMTSSGRGLRVCVSTTIVLSSLMVAFLVSASEYAPVILFPLLMHSTDGTYYYMHCMRKFFNTYWNTVMPAPDSVLYPNCIGRLCMRRCGKYNSISLYKCNYMIYTKYTIVM